tara:strand:+ start:1276 stop:1527 length:252 start_codon:yes stop_codon:yes gene_type:complete
MNDKSRYRNMPTAEEFNRKMHECIEYKKLKKLKEHLNETINWFGDKLGKDVKILHDRVCNRIKEIPKESIEFDREVHGDKTNH